MQRATALSVPEGIESLAEARIKAAMDAGEFDGLPGRGAPLRLDDDPLGRPEWRMAFRTLKNAGLAPAWIEAGQEIAEAVALARAALAAIPADDPKRAEAVARFADQAAVLNRRIALFNLTVPAPRWARSQIDVEQEIRRIGRDRRSNAEGSRTSIPATDNDDLGSSSGSVRR
jgi:hypothetical protein